jgi:hypothetical protein
MPFIAGRPPSFVLVEVCEKGEANAYPCLPTNEVDGARENTNRVRCEVALATFEKYIGGLQGPNASAIVDHVSPHLQDPEPTDERLVNGSSSEMVQVVDVPAK